METDIDFVAIGGNFQYYYILQKTIYTEYIIFVMELSDFMDLETKRLTNDTFVYSRPNFAEYKNDNRCEVSLNMKETKTFCKI